MVPLEQQARLAQLVQRPEDSRSQRSRASSAALRPLEAALSPRAAAVTAAVEVEAPAEWIRPAVQVRRLLDCCRHANSS